MPDRQGRVVREPVVIRRRTNYKNSRIATRSSRHWHYMLDNFFGPVKNIEGFFGRGLAEILLLGSTPKGLETPLSRRTPPAQVTADSNYLCDRNFTYQAFISRSSKANLIALRFQCISGPVSSSKWDSRPHRLAFQRVNSTERY